ncbi:MAG: DNA recombination protein RmuC [Spirochaetaceae bacterium]|nr:DNA recombination protein RmuC [Spirochaetaceae bacterium]
MNLLTIIILIISLITLSIVIITSRKKEDNRDLEIILKQNNETRKELMQMLENERSSLSNQIASFDSHLNLSLSNIENKNENLSKQVYQQLEKIREDNEKRLDVMRKTVDEKLTVTLNTRLNESFKLVSDQLESVHTSLGEMKSLSSGVGDLTRLLGNIKTRGTWGELQAENILSEILVSSQWEKNVITRSGSNYRVEYAIKLPGKGDGVVYLPIDAKFPKEDYERLQKYSLENNKEGIEISLKALAIRIEEEAKEISKKYIDPPNTTDFAILFLPLEGLYAEVLNIPGCFEKLISKYRVVISGPTTFSALINSLQLGFKTLALEKSSEEVWKVLSSIKTEFYRFNEQVEKVQSKLNQATSSLDHLGTRARVMNRKLKDVGVQKDELSTPLDDSFVEIDLDDLS